MSDKRVKGTSVAAFLFMPQFSLCFQHFSHIGPIFMRTLALMFAQAGLIPHNHPATRYGIEGVRKYSFPQLMGEAWYNLRVQRATPMQWGLFFSVILMIAVTVSALVTFLMTVTLGLGSVAQAQIFSNPNDPYGKGAGVTDIQGAGLNFTGGVKGAMFDSRTAYDVAGATSTNYASADLGLMVLDKVLRQSTVGTGGNMQNALTGLMQVYNTGIMVVAAVIIFWMILSIVVDTAKTGIVGGGRHNMVWTPIRVVFALGLMIPLGTTGFSSGQFAVMKLAEWGSNFATRAWTTYVTGVLDANSLVAGFLPSQEVGAVASGLARLKVCQIAYNTESRVQAGVPILFPNSYIVTRSTMPVLDPYRNTVTFTYSTTFGNVCGKIEFRIEDANNTTYAYAVAAAKGEHLLEQAAVAFQRQMSTALFGSWPNYTGLFNEGGPVMTQAHNFACAFVGRHMRPNGGGTNPVVEQGSNLPANAGCSAIGQCGAGTGGGGGGGTQSGFPDLSCHQTMVNTLMQRINNAYCGAADCSTATTGGALTQLVNYISTSMVTELTQKGWAGMGLFPHYIGLVNGFAMSARNLPVSVIPGTMWDVVQEQTDNANAQSLIEKKTREITSHYQLWWDQQMSDPTGGSINFDPASASAAVPQTSVNAGGFEFSGEAGSQSIASLVKAAASPGALMDALLGRLLPADQGAFFFAMHDPTGNVYPFVKLVEAGRTIMANAGKVWAAATLLQTLSSIQVLGNGLGSGLAESSLLRGLQSLSMMCMFAGMMLAYMVPVLPLLRVTFAVLTWIISVFEAVAMVPIAALAHLSSEGEGLAGAAKTCWILWLNVLLRPVMVVIGFVGAMLIFNTFVVYFHANFLNGVTALRAEMGFVYRMISTVAYTVIYVGAIYTAANSTFKLMDLIPSAMMRWMGGTPDQSFDDNSAAGMLYAASNVANSFGGSAIGKIDREGKGDLKNDSPKPPA